MELIDRWIAGELSGEMAEELERYFEENPEVLPGGEPTVDLLREAASLEESGDEVSALMNELKGGGEKASGELIHDSWRDLLEPCEVPGVLGRLEQYEVHGLIANTGMATVLKGRDPELDRPVAIKMLSPALSTNATARERFLREARAMATLENDYILPIYDVHQGGSPWFVMRYIDGGTLQDALDEGDTRLQEPEFVEELLYEMATALGVAHRAGIIHRDLKPANILCELDHGLMWLTDFGIARATEDPGLTYGKTVAGTPRYMSPEQAAGEELDERSDLFSLGSVLYHVATGCPPFDGATSSALLNQVANQEVPPVGRLNRRLPRWLGGLIDGLLGKDPKDRPASAGEVLKILSSRKVIKKPGRWLYPALGAGAALVVAGFFFKGGKGEKVSEPEVVNEVVAETIQEVISEATGRKYQSLQEAVGAVVGRDILKLRGEFILKAPLVTPVGSSVGFEPVEGETATIRFRHRGKYGILFRGDGAAKRIHFVNEERVDGFVSVLTQKARFLDLTWCQFEDTGSEGYSYAVHGHATRKIRMTFCSVGGGRMRGVFFCCAPEQGIFQGGDLHLEACRFRCDGVIALKGDHEDSRFRVRASRCEFDVPVLCVSHPSHPFRPISFRMRDNVFRVTESLLVINKGGHEEVAENLTWDGLNNVYAGGIDFVRFKDGKTVKSLEQFVRSFPGVSERKSQPGSLSRKKGRIEGFFEGVGETIKETLEDLKE